MMRSFGSQIQFFAFVLALGGAIGVAIHFFLKSDFDTRVGRIERDNAELRAQNEDLSARVSDLSEQNVALQRQLDRLERVAVGVGANVRVEEPACGLSVNVLRLCEERAEVVGEYTFALIRVDVSSGSPRAFMTVRRGEGAALLVDAFAGERRAVDGETRRVVVQGVLAAPPLVSMDVSALQTPR